MKTQIFKILFVISKTRVNRKGIAPIKCRITYRSKRKPFTTGLFVNPNVWNNAKQIVEGDTEDSIFLNTQLSLIKQEINQAFLYLQVNNKDFDVEDIYLQYKGENIKSEKTFIEMFDYHNSKIEKLIGISYEKSTYKKFEECKRLLKGFIKHKYNKTDLVLKNIKLQMLEDLDFYLKTERGQAQSTINKHIQRVRKVVKLAFAEEYLDKDPFCTLQR